jgi:hypothetical protein
MKKIILFLAIITLVSCDDGTKPKFIGQDIIDGKVSAIKPGTAGGYGHPADLPVIWVQTPTETRKVEIPFEYEGKWKVGDTCLLIIERYVEPTETTK